MSKELVATNKIRQMFVTIHTGIFMSYVSKPYD